MQNLKSIVVFVIAVATLTLSSCANFDDSTPCTPQVMNPDILPNCILGGTVCGACETEICADYTFPFPTEYLPGGSCRCSCK
jgi:hypothetical protein